MNRESLTFQESQLARMLKNEILADTQSVAKTTEEKQEQFSNIEYVSKATKPYVSPIFTMSEDELLAFVEEFDVNELATLSVAELNHIGEVMGVEPNILFGLED